MQALVRTEVTSNYRAGLSLVQKRTIKAEILIRVVASFCSQVDV